MKRGLMVIGQRCATKEEIDQVVDRIVRKFQPVKIILFGSYARGVATPESDVDLLIVVDDGLPCWQLATEISLAFEHNFPFDLIVKTESDLLSRVQANDFFLKDVLENGIILYDRPGQ